MPNSKKTSVQLTFIPRLNLGRHSPSLILDYEQGKIEWNRSALPIKAMLTKAKRELIGKICKRILMILSMKEPR